MENIFIFILAVGAAIFIALPFFKRSEEIPQATDSQNPGEERLRMEKRSIYSALKEIDFDYSTGKLSREDYDELKTRYKSQAVALLKEIDGIQVKGYVSDLDEKLEEEIRAVREVKLADDKEVEDEILRARKSRVSEGLILTCSKCENKYRPDDKFCSRCGARLNV